MKQEWSYLLGDDTITIVNNLFKEQIYFNGKLMKENASFIPSLSSMLKTTLTTTQGEKKELDVLLKAGFYAVNCSATLDGKAIELDGTKAQPTFKAKLGFILNIILSSLLGGAIAYYIVTYF